MRDKIKFIEKLAESMNENKIESPAGRAQQALTQGVQPLAGAGRDQQGVWRQGGRFLRGQGVGFVPDVNQGRGGRVSGDAFGDACVFGCVGGIGLARGVVQQQHGVGLADVLPGAGDADALGFVAAVAQACCVEHVYSDRKSVV